MIMLRFFLLLQLYHWTTFYKQTPWAFLLGVILFPYHLISRVMISKELHARLVLVAIGAFKNYWEIPGMIPTPPKFVKRRFLQLEAELKSQK